MNYNYSPKPCKVNGIQYRSRLEARWAVFFDFMGWEFEYEPCEFDLKGWMPDFYISSMDLLVDVKPLGMWDDKFINKLKVHSKEFNCAIFTESLVSLDREYFIGKVFNKKESPILLDISIPYCNRFDKYVIRNLWKEAQNKVMYYNPVL
jgi:predicted nuclease of restriction endonuclease-like RecB superfamily